MALAKRGLGKGLDGIIQNKNIAVPKESKLGDAAVLVDIKKIDRNKEQPRKKFDEEALEELADSIKEFGRVMLPQPG